MCNLYIFLFLVRRILHVFSLKMSCKFRIFAFKEKVYRLGKTSKFYIKKSSVSFETHKTGVKENVPGIIDWARENS